jgi:hypothetical protein
MTFPRTLYFHEDEVRWPELITASGRQGNREVLFNRFYQPIWSRADGRVTQGKPDEWVSFKTQRWFYDDGEVPWRGVRIKKKCFAILKAFQTGQPVDQWVLSK